RHSFSSTLVPDVTLRLFLVFLNAPPPTETSPLSLHDALPISAAQLRTRLGPPTATRTRGPWGSTAPTPSRFGWEGPTAPQHRSRSEEHTSELQSRENLVCRLLLEKKKKQNRDNERKNRPQIKQ